MSEKKYWLKEDEFEKEDGSAIIVEYDYEIESCQDYHGDQWAEAHLNPHRYWLTNWDSGAKDSDPIDCKGKTFKDLGVTDEAVKEIAEWLVDEAKAMAMEEKAELALEDQLANEEKPF